MGRPRRGVTAEDRFWASVERTSACWLWKAMTCSGGYGRFFVDGRRVQAHRYSYELLVGPIPPGMQIDHLCRVRGCVNPNHLQAVTPRENVMRSEGVAPMNARKTHCIHGHEYTPENTGINATIGGRYCRTCVKNRRHKDAA